MYLSMANICKMVTGRTSLLPSNVQTRVGFLLAYLDLTLIHSVANVNLAGWDGVMSNSLTFL